MRKIAYLVTLVVAFAAGFSACKSGRNAAKTPSFKPLDFPSVQVPAMVDDSADRMDYVIVHFWDNVLALSGGRCDSSYMESIDKEVVEQQFGLYTTLLWETAPSKYYTIVRDFYASMEKAAIKDTASNTFATITALARKYWYDANSPARNEEFYLPFAEGLAKTPLLPEENRLSYAYEADMCALNRVGTKAADIRFEDTKGRRRTLYGVDAEYLLLFFSNPGCPACKEITGNILSSRLISKLEDSGRLKVVDLYIDLEIDKWKQYSSEYPKEWICGYDYTYTIRTDLTYNVRAIPSLYLLDRNKKVIFKDADPQRIFVYLENVSEKS